MPNKKKRFRISIRKFTPFKWKLRNFNFKNGGPDILRPNLPKFEEGTFDLERKPKVENVFSHGNVSRKMENKIIVDIDIDLTKKIAATISLNGRTIFAKTKGD
ncbi:hypothetical protein [Burkholderia pyrrocinia]